MPGRALVDSSFYIDRMRAGRDPLEELAAFSEDWELLTCGVVQVEVLRGLKHKTARRRMADFLACLLYVPTLNGAWERAADLAWKMDREGKTMQVTDLLIATCALEAEAAVLTLDADFARVPGLRAIRSLG
ncbi:MAG: PIN domain-containing protein [Chthoniobacter sp.]|uniref:PIN domain-containing protein n=1 Tax=Chthoniobacter sp. TaxID=2510640 RepID=UPI0032A1C81F